MDHAMWNSDGHLIRTLDLMWEMLDQYLPEVDSEFGYGSTAHIDSLTGQSIGGVQEGDVVQEDDVMQEGDAQN